MNSIWLIGGTSESVAIVKILTEQIISLIVTVTTPTARTLYPANTKVIVGCMDSVAMTSFCLCHKITAVVDASHPYAVEVSRQAITITSKLNIPYLRYERASYLASKQPQPDSVIELDSFKTLLAGDYLDQQRVFLTVGCQALPQFQPWQSRSTLFARILPKLASLEIALEAGFTSDRLIAIRPPIDAATETALWQQWQISLVVTKASGTAGGEDIKRHVAANLGVPLFVIARPKIVYPQQTSIFSEIVAFCREARIE